ncbi:unnamed protein product [Bursaphelenchus okinawaensis]|uniref:1-phosphatidylinositol-3-phosphate 5-kinase n=1 Tax=Bursaphelenchus okinawaensis TaxID=465554 RepID=A0A811KI55_9BILA|nr:unnamed protein product [Bursaphelenchus okinawaensis]CAG9103510.1 unnamed protein product [Bursaphelenchus okinawaensis]
MSGITHVPSDLTLTSFPFDLKEDETAETGNSKSFMGFFNRLFTENNTEVPSSSPASLPSIEESTATESTPSQASPVSDASQTPSSSRKVSKLTKLLKPGVDKDLIDYNGSVFKTYWMPDSAVQECYECHERFTTFRRKHHCRFCGQIFCSKCCSRQVSGEELGYSGLLRLCTYCFERVALHFSNHDRQSRAQTPIQSSPSIKRKVSNTVTPVVTNIANDNIVNTDDDVPDILSGAGKPGVQEVQLPEFDSYLSSYEPQAEENEPDWVKNLRTKDDSVSTVFAPTSASVNAQVVSEKHETTPFEVKTRWDTFLCDQDSPPSNAQVFEAKTNALLDYLFEYEQISKDIWKPLLVPLAQEIVNAVNVDTTNRPKLINILDYVHIKKLCVTGERSVEKVNGVVFTKALHHRSMARYGENASVLLLAGNISYERVLEKMSSLEPILQQEVEYLKNQVERISSRKVNLVFVEHSISTLAVDMFLEAQIGVCTGLKSLVLERLSRCTGADIIKSLDAQFLQPRIGFCPRFYERSIRLANGSEKQLIVLDECDGSLGVSVVIRAESNRELKGVKRILKLLLQVYYSNKCELAFLQLFNSTGPLATSSCDVCAANQADDSDRNEDSDFGVALNECHLTNTPLIRIVAPYLERESGKNCFLLDYIKKPPFHFYKKSELIEMAEAEVEVEKKIKRLEEDMKENKIALEKKHVHSVLKSTNIRSSNLDLSEYRVRSAFLARRLTEVQKEMDEKSAEQEHLLLKQAFHKFEKPASRNVDVLNPYKHQRRAFLYCAEGVARRWLNSGSFCSGPSVLVWRFYSGGEDLTLGNFLKRFCFNAEYKCKECDKGMVDHFRKVIHHNSCIEITTQVIGPKSSLAEYCNTDEINEFDKQILIAWRLCSKCNAKTKVWPVNELVQNLSFAKFIDYLSNAVNWISETEKECKHCTFHESKHFFASNGMVTMFSVSTVNPLHVLFAPMICETKPRLVPSRSLVTEFNELSRLGQEVFKHVTESCTENLCLSYVKQLENYLNTLKEAFDEDGSIQTSSEVYTDNPIVVKSEGKLILIKHFLNAVIEEWNDRRGQQTTVIELDPMAKLKNLCAKFNLSLTVTEDKEDFSRLDTQTLIRSRDSEPKDISKSQSVQFPNPFEKEYHLELPIHKSVTPVVVRDSPDGKADIGSMIAFALSSRDYHDKKKMLSTKSLRPQSRNPSTSSFSSWSNLSNTAVFPQIPQQAIPSPKLEAIPVDDPTSTAVEVEFSDTKAHYYVKVYFAESFQNLREKLFPANENAFIRSISKSEGWSPQGGKSGASFYRTKDERFVFKQMSYVEMESFKKCAPKYFEYINKSLNEKKLTALCKIYGVFRVGYTSKKGGQLKMDLLVMEYLFYDKKVKQMWDLKGSLRNRCASTKTDMPVLLDENLVSDLWGNQLYVHHHSKVALKQAITNDSHFLSNQGIMDYSLLAGICEDTNEVVVGIVDYMRTYTLDKKVESFVKTALPNTHLPTVISPENYCKRFCDAIDCYFAMAPDQWTCLDSTVT